MKMRKTKMTNVVNKIIQCESGEMELEDQIEFFSELIRSEIINELQGRYQRVAQAFIDGGMISPTGEIL